MGTMGGDNQGRTDGKHPELDTSRTYALLDSLDVHQLADRWIDVEQTRTPVGWTPKNAVVRSTIERRLTEMMCKAQGTEAIEVELEARLLVEDKKPVEGKITKFGELGLFFATTKQLDTGTAVDIEIKREDNRLRVRGQVVEGNSNKLPEPGVRLKLIAGNEADERRVHRLLHDLLRHRT